MTRKKKTNKNKQTMNSLLINGLGTLSLQTADPYRRLAYTKAIKKISELTFEIKSAKDIPDTFSKKMTEHMQRVLAGCVPVSETLESVWGIGPAKARELRGLGIKSIDDLRDHVAAGHPVVPPAVILCLKYHNQLREKVPRQLITEFLAVVQARNKGLEITASGSYRRGLSVSGDIDILVTAEALDTQDTLVARNDMKSVLDSLSDNLLGVMSSKYKKSMCLCQFKSFVFHLDIRVVLHREYPFALLYFTGSKTLNTKMRQRAKDIGFRLNEYQLVGFIGRIRSEKDIFRALGMDFIPETQRSLL